MNEMIASCGLDCLVCPAYIATKENDDVKRKKVADMWSKLLKTTLAVKDINCDGCLSETGTLFGHCKNCPIRQSAKERKVKNCAYCPDYSCKKLDAFLDFLPNKEARKNLERIRKEIARA
jgi:hypothetical protein